MRKRDRYLGLFLATLLVGGAAVAALYDVDENTTRFSPSSQEAVAATMLECRKACYDSTSCKSWNWTKPHATGTGKGRCWLIGVVANPSANTCCDSGVKKSIKLSPNTPKPPK